MQNKLNIAVIGCCHMARLHMKGVLSKEGAELYAICDTLPSQIEEAQKEIDCTRTTTDWRTLVGDPAVDAVIIVTPDQYHREMTEAFLRAGKHVLCEKPMALTLADCESMMRAERESGRRLMIGQVCRCTPAFMMAKELVDAGRIGELVFVESEYAHNYNHARGVGDWRVVPERHAFIGGGCHAVDLLRWIAGDPSEVYALANHKIMTDWPVDDTSVALYRFPNGVPGKVFVSIGAKRDYTMRSVFYGTRGTIICDNTSPTLTLYEQNEEGEGFTEGQQLAVEVNNHNINAEVHLFIDAIRNGTPLPVSSYEGAATVAVCCATVESAAVGRPIEIRYPEI